MHIYRNDSPTETGWPGSSRAGAPVQQPNSQAKSASSPLSQPPVVAVKKKKGKAVVKHRVPDPELLEDNTSTLIDAAPSTQSKGNGQGQPATTVQPKDKRVARADAGDSDEFRNVWDE